MNIYTYSEARQKLSKILDLAKRDGVAIIKRKDGSIFELKPVVREKSALDIKGIDVKINKSEINSILREVRERD